jgi:hypothetical protein
MDYIGEDQLERQAESLVKSGYGSYLYQVLKKGKDY